MLSLSTPIIELSTHGLKGVGTTTANKLAASIASISGRSDPSESTLEDLLSYFPARYEDRSNLTKVHELHDGVETSVELFVNTAGGFQVRRSRTSGSQLFIFEIHASDRERLVKPVTVWWFVSGRQAHRIINYNRDRFRQGVHFIAYGKWSWDSRHRAFALQINQPDELELLSSSDSEMETESDEKIFPAIHVGRRVPVYRKLGEIRTKQMREIMHAVLQRLGGNLIEETLPEEIIKRYKLISRYSVLSQIHFPGEDVPLEEYHNYRSPAHIRLIFEEFFWLAFTLAYRRNQRKSEPKGTIIELSDRIRERIKSILPFQLTGAQQRAFERIAKDMASGAPMNRLLQGDVGSGKTVVAVLAMLTAMENGYQASLMVPTEILAEQHARNISHLLKETDFKVLLLTGSMPARAKRKALDQIGSGEIVACIGTHALIQEGVNFSGLGLVVIDEQQRFGVLQRAAIREQGSNPDLLVMTATPIPRSLAMTVYGDLDISVIDEMPPGRTPLKTVLVDENRRAGVYKSIERELRADRQAYIVYPLIEESEKVDLRDATNMYAHLRDTVFKDFKVGLLHGRMKPQEKAAVMNGFVEGNIQILVSTTVVEVGVDVANATVMVIEHAERFGLSQLHQLRGRVGRGAEQSY
ncbi:MAG: ATP-dependent DNA helicase RecG, partial [Pyrinomonadaceae bacterium]